MISVGAVRAPEGVQVGTVSALFRYPVKSMAAESLDEATFGWHGMLGDRRFAFVQADNKSDFPWLTIREVPAMMRYQPVTAAEAEKVPPTVTTPGGRELPVTDPELLEELAAAHGKPVHLLRSERGLFDVFTVSVLSSQTVEGMGELAGSDLEPLRFRPNILVDAPGRAFPEDGWVGRIVTFGTGEDALRVRLDVRDARCMVINFDHATVERNPEVLRAAAQKRDGCVGVYGSVEREGIVRVGDPILLLDG